MHTSHYYNINLKHNKTGKESSLSYSSQQHIWYGTSVSFALRVKQAITVLSNLAMLLMYIKTGVAT